MLVSKLKKAALVVLIASLIVNIVAFTVVLPAETAFGDDQQGFAMLKIYVYDGVSNRPLENATVCIPEVNGYYHTGADGSTVLISVPTLRNTNFDDVHMRSWGEVTLLVYREGYIDFILFYLMVQADKTRIGPNIALYPTATPDDNILHSLIESPENSWAEEIRDKYKK